MRRGSAFSQEAFDEAWPSIVEWSKVTVKKFGLGNPVPSLLLPGAPHYIYIDNEAEVVREMRKFLGIAVAGN
jgi:hypothetical protein